jgi:excisionase family DNA binding protein
VELRPDPFDLLDYSGAAKYLGRNEKWLQKMADERRIAYFVVGRRRRFARADLDSFLLACRRPAVAAQGGGSLVG